MSDRPARAGDPGASLGGTGIPNLDIAYSDDGASLLPQTTLFSSGTFKPTQYASIGSFPSPGPGLAYNSPAPLGTSTFSSTFAFTNPNGNWSLYAFDPVSGDSGEISDGWNLQINAAAVPEPASLTLITIAAGAYSPGAAHGVYSENGPKASHQRSACADHDGNCSIECVWWSSILNEYR